MSLLGQTPRVKTTPIQHNFDPLLIDEINGHFNTFPACWNPTIMFAFGIRFRIIRKIDFCTCQSTIFGPTNGCSLS
jgi:hypothetical protein